jgi:hypothetical protein
MSGVQGKVIKAAVRSMKMLGEEVWSCASALAVYPYVSRYKSRSVVLLIQRTKTFLETFDGNRQFSFGRFRWRRVYTGLAQSFTLLTRGLTAWNREQLD